MSWDATRSIERAQKAWQDTDGLQVTDLVRETDFDNTPLNCPRRVTGAHIYVDVPGFRSLITGADGTPDEATARHLHLWGREISRVVETDFTAVKIHFQGPRLHAVVYRPIADQTAVATNAVLLAAAVRATAGAFNDTLGLSGTQRWRTAAGTAHGVALLTKNGSSGDRELLFLGKPANQAAKIITSSGLRVDGTIAQHLHADVTPYLLDPATGDTVSELSADSTYALNIPDADLEQLCADRNIAWTLEGSRTRISTDDINIGNIKVSRSLGNIDKSTLSLTNTKSAFGISLFADVDGFTAHISNADADGTLDEAVRQFHTIRLETRHTVVQDYVGLRIQYQGDRVQALTHQPVADHQAIALKAVRTAAAITSVFAHTLPAVIGDTDLKVAIGLAAGDVLVSKLGQYGDRDVVCLGTSTADAARIQEALDGGQTGIDSTLYKLLPTWLQDAFLWHPTAKAYVADDLTLDQIDQLEVGAADDPAAALLSAARSTHPARPAVAVPTLRPYCRGPQ